MKWLLASVAILILGLACGYPRVDQFDPIVIIRGRWLQVGIDTDLPDDAYLGGYVYRYFRISSDSRLRPMTIAGIDGTVAEIREGYTVDLEAEGRDFYQQLRGRLPHNPDWGKVFTTPRHYVRLFYSPNQGPLRGNAVEDEGDESVGAKIDFYWGTSKRVLP